MQLDDIIFRIGYFRNLKNLSARELSLRIGKSPTYINQIESKNFKVSLPTLLEIIEALEITCAEFFSDNYENYKQDKELLDVLNQLPSDRKKLLIDKIQNTKIYLF